jgi:hypothetical protein
MRVDVCLANQIAFLSCFEIFPLLVVGMGMSNARQGVCSVTCTLRPDLEMCGAEIRDLTLSLLVPTLCICSCR